MHGDRLLRLARLLREDAANPKGVKFDMGTWGKAGVLRTPGVSCGTAACAMGLAALSGEFAAEGLKAKIEGFWRPHVFPTMPGFARSGYWAAMDLFDIGYNDAAFLFSPDGWNDRRAVAEVAVSERIEKYVATNLAPASE